MRDSGSLIERKLTRQVQVGGVTIGGDAPIRLQSMTTSHTRDVEQTVDQIQALAEVGCELVRVACPTEQDARALGKIRSRIKIPLIVDIHFNHRFALIALDEGVDKLRLNPGNIGKRERTVEIVKKAKNQKVPIRIGVNAGSLEKDLMEKFGPTPEALVESARRHIQILEALGFRKGVRVISCPSCGRAEVDVFKLAQEVENRAMKLEDPMTISVLGCVVNGPGEAHESDFGITGGKDKGMIYIDGKQHRVVDEKALVDELFKEIESKETKDKA